MFCYQCEQTARNQACTVRGVCGKTPEVAALQDLLTHGLKGLARVALRAREHGIVDAEADAFTAGALFSTLTNVNFDEERFAGLTSDLVDHRERLEDAVRRAGGGLDFAEPASDFTPARDLASLVDQGQRHGFTPPEEADDADVASLKHTLLFGIRGAAAYVDHARILGHEDHEVYAFLHRALAALDQDLDVAAALDLVMECGRANLRAMELLDAAHTGTFGHPVPTEVPLGPKAGKAILVSGHDLHDLAALLEQTRGTGINVYTHGEMLPAHGYPELNRHEHLAGHYGTAWQNQAREFAEFPGAILMTTNCIQKPRETYVDNIFTTGLVGWPGVTHVPGPDFAPVIEKAQAMDGFSQAREAGSVTVGFAHNAVLSAAPQVLEAVHNGDIRRFFLVAGCDGAKPGRNYYTEFVEKLPADTVVMTLACGKFRFFDKDLGTIGAFPRLMDVGQCNDAFSAVKIAQGLAEALGVGINDLPLSMVLSWYEQKAVAILLSLLALGVKDIRLGPSLPAFLSPTVLGHLVENYGIRPIATPEEDIRDILGDEALQQV